MTKKPTGAPPEISAIGTVYDALRSLEPTAQLRVLKYSAEMLGLRFEIPATQNSSTLYDSEVTSDDPSTIEPIASSSSDTQIFDDAEGINAVALKWMKRSGINAKDLQPFFSLGIEEIDLVATSVAGDAKRARMRNVLLLKGIAAYLGTGTPRVSYEQLKEACLHYDAYDATNFAKNLKAFSSEVTGTKSVGFTLTARGLTSATELLKEMMRSKA